MGRLPAVSRVKEMGWIWSIWVCGDRHVQGSAVTAAQGRDRELLAAAGSGRYRYRSRVDGGVRTLGVPTVADRVAQTVVHLGLEPQVEPMFHRVPAGPLGT